MERKTSLNGSRQGACVALLALLKERGYRFVTPTPRTHEIVLARHAGNLARSVVDVLGWSRPFELGTIDREIEGSLEHAGLLEGPPERRRATVRVSSLRDRLFLHSAYPTTACDAVFFGPDSYRFADFITVEFDRASSEDVTIIDVGTGAGVGAIVARELCPNARVIAIDINPAALELAQINAAAAGVRIETICGDILQGYAGPADIVLANPPYILDAGRRAYRHGGGMHGAELSARMVAAVLPRLAIDGTFILYTGSTIIAGQDRLHDAVVRLADTNGCTLFYRELDPDVFGEELERAAYADADRIAVVGAVFRKRCARR
ncbi:MAG: methyltransferase [Sphingomicrobium sp.]|nr:class I SAM-dependent methyltransferase [Sphingomonadales bacterium]